MPAVQLSYSINDLARLTGIKAHTIRIWEKRYGLLDPDRTTTNIRQYSDEDLRKILNVSTLLKQGWKISRVSSLDTQQLESEIWKSVSGEQEVERVYEVYTQAMLSAGLSFDEEWFRTVYTDATTRFGLPGVMEYIIGPLLTQVGLMWTVTKLHPGHEHFVSNLIRRKILSAIDRLPRLGSSGKYLLFLPPWEEHEIGLLYAEYLIRAAGNDVIFLGQRVPWPALQETIHGVNPDSLLTFVTTHHPIDEIAEFFEVVCGEFAGQCLMATGLDMDPDTLPANVQILSSAEELHRLL